MPISNIRSRSASVTRLRRPLARLLMALSAPLALPALAGGILLDLPLEDLLKVEITSASRKSQHVQDVAAAVFVITREDIERSGARTIPEALRLAPGLEVARIGNNRWAVSIRGFNGRFANKLLVLKDGRSVYSPLFSGVMWEDEDTILGDVERIEVIRGPGAAMWGTNAVNGVINIISRSAAGAASTELSISSASDEPGSISLRQEGIKIGDGYLRLSAKAFDLNPAHTGSGTEGNDGWRATRLGLRGDWPAADGGNWTLVGEAYQSQADDRLDYTRYAAATPLFDMRQRDSGSNLVLRREQPTANGGQLEWQVSAQTSVVDLETLIHENRQIVAAEFQHNVPLDGHAFVWGASYRFSRDNIELPGSGALNFIPFSQPQRNWRLTSVFLHDEYALIAKRLHLSGGVRVDNDSWSGTQVQPDLRLTYTPDPDTTWWTSLSRAARTPSRLELDVPFSLSQTVAVPPYIPSVLTVRAPPLPDTVTAEVVTALETGWRSRISAQLSLDLSAFVSDYRNLLSTVTQPMQVISPDMVLVPLTTSNAAQARTHGFELAADWQVSPIWRVQPVYSRLYLNSATLADPATAAEQNLWQGRVARDRLSLRSSWTLSNGHQFDFWLKYVSALSNPQVPAYTAVDLRYALPLGTQGSLAVIGQNLLKQRHPEFVSDYLPVQQTEIGRSLMVKATWHF